MAYTTIKKPSDYFNTKLYTGTGSAGQAQTGVGFQPDLVWTKSRSNTYPHQWYDVIRGVTKRLQSNDTSAEATQSNGLTSFDSDGFTVGDASGTGVNNATYASWNWKANGAGVANTDGSISSTVSANTTSGFSIVKWTGTNSNGTIGHGLGTTPSLFISKSMAGTHAWGVYHKSIGIGSTTLLNSTGASDADATYYGGTSPTSTTMGLGTANATNASGDMIGYAFAEKQGFSKFGSYTGNGNADGTFIYTGFKPAFVLIKNSSAVTDWCLRDNKRSPINVTQHTLFPNTNDSESYGGTSYDIDFLSNGFKIRNTSSRFNTSSNNYIYMAFAEQPLVGDNPATAR